MINPIGKIYGKLTVVSVFSRVQSGASRRYCGCRCECGELKDILLQNLMNGKSTSCGNHGNNIVHGLSKHPLYVNFKGIKERCYDKNSKDYDNYGGRGIGICDEWLNNPASYIEWALKNGWTEGCLLQIDRKENDKGYSPENCRFVSSKENNRNKRSTTKKNLFGQNKPAPHFIFSCFCPLSFLKSAKKSDLLIFISYSITKSDCVMRNTSHSLEPK